MINSVKAREALRALVDRREGQYGRYGLLDCEVDRRRAQWNNDGVVVFDVGPDITLLINSATKLTTKLRYQLYSFKINNKLMGPISADRDTL